MVVENKADGPSSAFSGTRIVYANEGRRDTGDSRNIELRRDDV